MEASSISFNTLNEYQNAAMETAVFPRENNYGFVYPALGLNGEAGEVADKVKKVIRDHDGLLSAQMAESIALELGDVLWYVAVMAEAIGFSLKDIAWMNYRKLKSRQSRGVLGGSGDYR